MTSCIKLIYNWSHQATLELPGKPLVMAQALPKIDDRLLTGGPRRWMGSDRPGLASGDVCNLCVYV